MYPNKHRKKSLLTYFSSFLRLSLPQKWGMEIKFKKVVTLPCLKIESFSLKSPGGKSTPKQWKNVEFQVKDFDFTEHMSSRFSDLDLGDWAFELPNSVTVTVSDFFSLLLVGSTGPLIAVNHKLLSYMTDCELTALYFMYNPFLFNCFK